MQPASNTENLIRPGQGERGSELAIAFLRNPHDGHPPAGGQTMLPVSLFREGKPHTDAARSLTIIAGQDRWKLTPSKFGMNYIVGEQADAARASFLTAPVTVQAAESDGNIKTFVVTPKGFKVANATFIACVAELLLDKPARPATRYIINAAAADRSGNRLSCCTSWLHVVRVACSRPTCR